MDEEDFYWACIKPSLTKLAVLCEAPAIFSDTAGALMLGTAVVESGIGANGLYQRGGGPGRGVYQIEASTWEDVVDRYCRERLPLVYEVLQWLDPEEAAITDLCRATQVARLKYWMQPAALPPNSDGLAGYWRRYYNSRTDKPLQNWQLQAFNRAWGIAGC